MAKDSLDWLRTYAPLEDKRQKTMEKKTEL